MVIGFSLYTIYVNKKYTEIEIKIDIFCGLHLGKRIKNVLKFLRIFLFEEYALKISFNMKCTFYLVCQLFLRNTFYILFKYFSAIYSILYNIMRLEIFLKEFKGKKMWLMHANMRATVHFFIISFQELQH